MKTANEPIIQIRNVYKYFKNDIQALRRIARYFSRRSRYDYRPVRLGKIYAPAQY